MGSELVTDLASPPTIKGYTEQFYEHFPFYLSIGMTYEQYWDGDCTLPKYYREAYKLRQKHENTLAWLHGRYVYDALCFVSPVLHAFAKKGTTVLPYLNEPYAIGNAQTEPNQQDIQAANAAARFNAFASQFNKKFDTKEGN